MVIHTAIDGHQETVASQVKTASVWPAKVLLISLALPFFFPVGPLLLTADRIVLLAAFVPCVTLWLSGKAGPVHITDVAVGLLWLWMSISMLVIEGLAATVEGAGINLLETVGAYLVARCFVRDAESFLEVVRFLNKMILALLPFAVYEALTAQNPLLDIANQVWPSYANFPMEPRWGLDRVALVFHHPILFGVFCGSGFALTYYVLGYHSSSIARASRTSIVAFTTFLSLSSGPFTALIAQVGLISWDKLLSHFKLRWKVLCAGVASLWIVLEVAATRSVPEVFIAYFAFNTGTAYNRIRIWRFGTQSVADHPWFGIGRYGEWERPGWMSDSMDMFWLLPAVQQGLPAGLLLHAAFFSMFLTVAFRRGLDAQTSAYRTGFLICMFGFYMAGWTVHYWKVIYVLFMFLLGSGIWIASSRRTEETHQSGAVSEPRTPSATRSRELFAGDIFGAREPHDMQLGADHQQSRRAPNFGRSHEDEQDRRLTNDLQFQRGGSRKAAGEPPRFSRPRQGSDR